MLARLVALASLVVLMPAAYDATVAEAGRPGCQGEWPTIVGSPGDRVEGTDGPDVIISNGAKLVDAGGGDDRVCLTGERPGGQFARVVAGPGDDKVVVHLDRPGPALVELGPGDDTYLGGPGTDTVKGEILGSDDIRTGAGADSVNVYQQGPLDDRIDLGRGADDAFVRAEGMAPTGSLDGAQGRDHLLLGYGSHGATVVDNVSGTITDDGTVDLSWVGFEDFEISTSDVPRLDIVGGPASETFVVSYGRVDTASLAGGDDVLGWQLRYVPEGVVPVLDGGPGKDHLAPASSKGSARVDLTEDTAHFSEFDVTARVPGFENASVTARQVTLVGDQGRNRLAGYGCNTRVAGSGGPDVLAYARPYTTLFDCAIRTVLRGGGGDDLLLGGPRGDELYGNAGSDVARAGGGRDLCRSVERRKGCERS